MKRLKLMTLLGSIVFAGVVGILVVGQGPLQEFPGDVAVAGNITAGSQTISGDLTVNGTVGAGVVQAGTFLDGEIPVCLQDGTDCPGGLGGWRGVLYGGSVGNLSNSATNYFPTSGMGVPGTVSGNFFVLIDGLNGYGITPNRLKCHSNAAPAGAATWTVTMQDTGVDTNWVCLLNLAGAGACEDTAGSAFTTGNHYLSFKVVPSGSPTASPIQCALAFTYES